MIKHIVICTAQTPYVYGGAEVLVDTFCEKLNEKGFIATVVQLPFKWYPTDEIIKQAIAWRFIELEESNGTPIDLVIATKFPSYYIRHHNKVTWLIHQHRPAYDLLGTEYSDFKESSYEDKEIISSLVMLDSKYLSESKKIFSQSKTVANRLKKYNNLDSEILYPPPRELNYHCSNYGDYIFTVSRLDKLKRIETIIEAFRFTQSQATLRIAGDGPERDNLKALVKKFGLNEKVEFLGKITDEELTIQYSETLAVYFAPYYEDYGYITVEAFLSKKPVITTTDSGGVTELVEHEKNGFVVPLDPKEIALAVDKLYYDKAFAKNMGEKGHYNVNGITWDSVINKLIGNENNEI